MDIQHGPKILQRFKAAHEPLIKALFNFESMESHGKPIKPVLRQLITWTPPKEGITLLKFFGGIGIGLEALLTQGWWFKGIATQTLILLQGKWRH